MSGYLEFVKTGVQTLLERQSARLGGKPDGVLCITVTKQTCRTNRRVRVRDGKLSVSDLAVEAPIEREPYRLDLRIWPVLELFSDVTGDSKYRQMVVEMASAFGRCGFDPASGLGYLGATAEFDVLRLHPVTDSIRTRLIFKPSLDLPIDRLWSEAPEQTARMFKSAYYALITRPEDMAYNRTCPYGFDDSAKKPFLKFNSQHVGFAQSGAALIHWWGYHFARTDDRECLAWAKAMADKWQAVQHAETGLVPHCFSHDRAGESTQPPWVYANEGETITGILLLRASSEFRKRPEGMALAEQVREMGSRLLNGIARHGYAPRERIFPQWLYLDGRVPQGTVFYTFSTQAEKDAAVKQNPLFGEVEVYAGLGFYTAAPWALCAHNGIPHDLALGASLTGEAGLLRRTQELAADLMEEAGSLTSEFNALGQWTYPASASYIEMMLLLFKLTKEGRYLDWARRLADMELELLSRPLPEGKPEWWRMPFRGDLLGALLLLHRAVATA